MMIEIIACILIGLFSFVFGVILGKRGKHDKLHDNAEKTENRPIGANETFKELQAVIDSASGNPIAVDDKIREWLRK